jgi:hypothetical protein
MTNFKNLPEAVAYEAFYEENSTPEIGYYATYGIRALTGRGLADMIHDVSPNKDAATALARMFTEGELSLIHFMDAVQDAIGIVA